MLVALFGFLLLFVGFRRTDDPEFDFAGALVRGSLLHAACAILYFVFEAPLWFSLSPLLVGLVWLRLSKKIVVTGLSLILICFTFSNLFLSRVKSSDDFEIARSVSIYPVPDHVLQWYVSDNFYKNLPLETGFNPDKKQLWSVGDRPIFIGLLNAWFGEIIEHSKEQYFLRMIFLSSMLWLFVSRFLRVELGITGFLPRFLILLMFLTSPFFITNTIYTWPKLASMTYIFAAIALFPSAPVLGGFSAALGVLCHSGGQFGVLFLVVWFLRSILKDKRILKFLFGFFIITIPHNVYLKANSNQTGLYHRVILCRGGSYAVPTPVISLKEACRSYYESAGVNGIVDDRIQSLKKAFLDGYHRVVPLLSTITSKPSLKEWYISILSYPSFSYGVFSLGIGLVFIFLKESRLIFLGASLLGIFSLLLAEYSVMVAHGIPYIIQIVIGLGVVYTLNRFRFLLYLYCLSSIFLSLGMWSVVPQLGLDISLPVSLLAIGSFLLSIEPDKFSLSTFKKNSPSTSDASATTI